jgi:hypothetical protein
VRVHDALADLATGALRRIASRHGLPADDASTRAELIERLEERLTDPVYLHELIDSLPEDQQAALSAARASGGEVRGFLLDRDRPGAADELLDLGLLFRTFAAAGPRRGEVFALPDELLDLLPAPPGAAPPPTSDQVPSERRSSEPAFSLFALASTLQRPTSDLQVEVGGWSEEPGGWEWSLRWSFFRQLGLASGLLVAHGTSVTVGSQLPRLLNDPQALADRLWRTYQQHHSWSEVAQLELAAESPAEVADATLLRAAVIEAVERLPEGAWIDLAAFSNWLKESSPNLVREQLDARGRLLLESMSWEQLELPLLRVFILGPLYWLGVVAASVDGHRFARRPVLRSHAGEPCAWAGSSELIAPVRAELGTLLEAERYLVLEERGRPSRYRLLQRHVAGALGTGGSIDECRRLLRRLTGAALPDVVEERLAEWHERFGALLVRPSVILEARTESDLDAALDEAAVRPFVRGRLGPLAAEVAAADVLELANALRESGHLPRVDAALRLTSEPRHTYPGLIDERVLEFLLVSLLAFQRTRPERLSELEGALSLIERLERQFAPERLHDLRLAADRLAGELRAAPPPAPGRRRRQSRPHVPSRRAPDRTTRRLPPP